MIYEPLQVSRSFEKGIKKFRELGALGKCGSPRGQTQCQKNSSHGKITFSMIWGWLIKSLLYPLSLQRKKQLECSRRIYNLLCYFFFILNYPIERRCPNITIINSVNITERPGVYQTRYNVDCISGYVITGDATYYNTTCLDDKTWSHVEHCYRK